MTARIFVKLPLTDPKQSTGFVTRPGIDYNPACTDATATCPVVRADISAMPLMHEKFRTIPHRPVCHARLSTGAPICFTRSGQVRDLHSMHPETATIA